MTRFSTVLQSLFVTKFPSFNIASNFEPEKLFKTTNLLKPQVVIFLDRTKL